ncbi:unnamed protein product [Sphagnum tenellum]
MNVFYDYPAPNDDGATAFDDSTPKDDMESDDEDVELKPEGVALLFLPCLDQELSILHVDLFLAVFIDGRNVVDWHVDQRVFQNASIRARQALAEQDRVDHSLNEVARRDDRVQMLLGLEQGLGHVFNRAPARWCGLHQRSHARGLLQLTKLRLRCVVVMEEFDNTVAIFNEIVNVVERVAVKASVVRHMVAPLKCKSTFDRSSAWHLSRTVESSYLCDGNKISLGRSVQMAFFMCKSSTCWNEVPVANWLRSTLLVATVPLWALAVLHAVHDLTECGTLVEVNLYQLALLMVIDEHFAMLVDVQLGIVRVCSVGGELPNRGLCPTALLRRGLLSYSSASWLSQLLSPSIMDPGVPSLCWPPALSPFKSSMSLEMGKSLEFDIGVALLLGNKAPRLWMPDCDCAAGAKAKLNAKP